MRLLIAFLFISNIAFSQFDSTMYDLVKTTFERSFDRHIINAYLHSQSQKKIKAAILSISQSEDTTFVDDLLKIDPSNYGNDICFSLAQLGTCSKSLKFLWNFLNSSYPETDYKNVFYAIGKIGNQNDLNKLVNYYNSFLNDSFPIVGISTAILQFQLRGITSSEAKSILIRELNLFPKNPDRVSEALFTLTRYNSSEDAFKKFVEILLLNKNTNQYLLNDDKTIAYDEIKLKVYALLNFQRLKKFDVDDEIILNIITGNNDLLKIELAKSIIYWNKKENIKKVLNYIFNLMNDKNINVAIQSANSLNNLDYEFTKDQKEYLYDKMIGLLNDPQKNNLLKSEIFLSGYKLLGNYDQFSKIISNFSPTIECKVKFAAINPNQNDAVKDLTKYYNSSDLKVKIEALTQLLKFLPNNKYKSELNITLLDAISSNFPPLISIAADGLDSSFIQYNSIKLEHIIIEQLKKIKDNPDYLEATLSLLQLSKKINKEFYLHTLETTKSSKLYSVRKYINSNLKRKQKDKKELDEFESIWNFAFKYSKAKINTSKGIIEIKFNPGIAPVSVGNFCKLANQHFYDQILFHRVVPGFVIQAGDPTATGWCGPGYDIVSEFSNINFNTGYVGMASAGKDTEGSQFFIMQGNFPHLDGRYTNFAHVLNGMEVVLRTTQEDKIISIELIK